LSEEGKDDVARLSVEWVWIVDFFDGTCEYSEVLRDDWVVYVVLWECGVLVVGMVVFFVCGVIFVIDVFVVWLVGIFECICFVVSCLCLLVFVVVLVEVLDVELVLMGSVGVKVIVVFDDVVDVYVYVGG